MGGLGRHILNKTVNSISSAPPFKINLNFKVKSVTISIYHGEFLWWMFVVLFSPLPAASTKVYNIINLYSLKSLFIQ